jgi:hypothetical protein
MLQKIQKFLKLKREEKKLFLEAYIMLGLMHAAILTISFKYLTRSLEHHPNEIEVTPLNDKEIQAAISVGQAITRAAAYTPWESACLAQSLTAKNMLQKRGISGVFYLGAAKDEESKENMKAHAWSQCGDTIITGAKGHEAFTVLSVFGWTGKQTV